MLFRSILNERYEEVYRLAPEYTEIEQEIINISMDAARGRILGQSIDSSSQEANYNNSGSQGESSKLHSKLSELNNRKIQCLIRIGKPADYLSCAQRVVSLDVRARSCHTIVVRSQPGFPFLPLSTRRVEPQSLFILSLSHPPFFFYYCRENVPSP